MAHSSWGPGWPDCQPHHIDSDFSVSGTRFPGGMRYELVDLVTMLVQETKNRGYQFGTDNDPSYGCWGYSCRAISGSNTPSNHSWGLAVDINAPNNPYTSPLVTDMPSWMPELWNEYGFRWGGDYTGDKDAMHYEYMGSVTDAATDTARARADGIGGGTPPPTGDWFDMATEEDLDRVIKNNYDGIARTVWENYFVDLVGAQGGSSMKDVVAATLNEQRTLKDVVWDEHYEDVPGGGGAQASTGDILKSVYDEVVKLRPETG